MLITVSPRLILRPWRSSDALALCSFAAQGAQAGFPVPQDPADARRIIVTQLMRRAGEWALCLDGQVIGAVSLRSTADPAERSMGYLLCDRYRGMGYMTKAVAALLAAVTKNGQIRRIRAFIGPDNLPSQRLAQRSEFILQSDGTWLFTVSAAP